jgi:WhiB family redox-sensing transcriptional regulator
METLETVLDRWWENAACRGMDIDLFIFEFGERHINRKIKEAKAVCAVCPVRQECLDEALKFSTTRQDCCGIWGGLTWKERQRLERKEVVEPIPATPLVYRDGKYRQIKEPRP